ncbi:STAS domain-containing protein [Bacillus mangrovi]|uniref:STAS domain-containing protein n=1 Tax=Metabacillus mangrovi TaxID=1491830 RepID=A0A7X2S571_9BACI|nr:STAS domain-containing protein [Metabacillus mangrovi]MTH53016.1 STAS domain-containing protein [Metabacillus mangrovi]
MISANIDLQSFKKMVMQGSYKTQDSASFRGGPSDLTVWREKLIEIYANSLTLSPEKSEAEVKDWGKEFANKLVELGLPLDTALKEMRTAKNEISHIIKEEANRQNLSANDFFKVYSTFDYVVDRAAELVSACYMKAHDEKISSAQHAVDELSIPVVKIEEGIGILPVIGDIDTRRAQLLMVTALEKSAEFKLEYLILDLSGVPVIDTMVAQQIFEVLEALRISGVTSKISGIRPELAITMTQLGVNFEVQSFSSLHQAIASIKI